MLSFGLLYMILSLYYVITLGETLGHIEYGLITSNQALEEQINKIFDDEDLLQELFPMLKKSCVKSALQIYLPQCLLEGVETITDSIKMETAVRLSLCQFEASGLAHIPEECSHTRNTEDMMDCMLQLETSNQWWTTYNGYYQNLPMMCVTHGSMFQKEQIIKTFLNMTKFINQLNENWGSTFKTNIIEVDKIISQNLDNLTTRFNNTLNRVDNLNATMNAIFQEMEIGWSENKDRFQIYLSKKDEEILRSLEILQNFIEQFKDEVINEDFLLNLENQRRRELSLWNEMETSLQAERNTRQIEQENINIYIDNLKSNIINLSKDVETLNQFQIKNLETHIQTALVNISNQMINEWLSLTKILNKDIQYWNEFIMNNFRVISNKLEITIEKIDFVESKISKLMKVIIKISALLDFCFKFACKIFTNCKTFAIFVLFLPLIKILKLKIPILKIHRIVIIVIGILIGNQLGHKINIKSFMYRITMISNSD